MAGFLHYKLKIIKKLFGIKQKIAKLEKVSSNIPVLPSTVRCKRKALALPLFCWAVAAVHASSADAALDPSKPLTQFHQWVWGTGQGLPQNTVPAISQSPDGYLWLGTELGLARFDGLHFTVFDKSNTPELKSNKIDAVVTGRNGDLWIGTIGGGLSLLRHGKFKTFTKIDGLSSDSILCIFIDRSGELWAGTNGGGVDRLHNGHFIAYTSKNGLADNEVFAVVQDGMEISGWPLTMG